jgi:hypothetical protein
VLSLETVTSNWINNANSYLRVYTSFLGNLNNFNFAATGNTVVCHGNCYNVPASTYFNLVISATGTKVASGHITILNDFTALNNSSANILNLNGFNLNIAGNWNNQVNQNVQNQGLLLLMVQDYKL